MNFKSLIFKSKSRNKDRSRAAVRNTLYGLVLITMSLTQTGCQIGYLVKGAYHQIGILTSREDIEDVLKEGQLNDKEKRKLRLVLEVRQFATKRLGLKKSDNYTSYVGLDRPYVSYVLSAAPRHRLEHHLWWFPIVGSVPYKGYFSPEEAKEAAKEFPKSKYDTYVRGVSAYSTLGWFDDPVLSSMLAYKEHRLVNVIIHETVHATIYIKGHADFNERLATFIGDMGTELFYQNKEGKDSPTVQLIAKSNEDQKLFSQFISKEIKSLKEWYKDKSESLDESLRQDRIQKINQRFTSELLPKMKTKNYSGFSKVKLNNARLMVYSTYMKDQSDFKKLYEKLGRDFKKLIEYCKSLEKTENPEQELKNFIKS